MKKGGVLHLIDSGGFYGAEAVILNLCLGLEDSGFRQVIGCFIPDSKQHNELGLTAEKKGIRVRYISMKNKINLGGLKQLRDIIKEEKIMLIHSHGYKPSFYCLLLHILYKVPYIITCHLWTMDNFKYRLYVLLDRISMLFAERVVAVSQPIMNDIYRWKINRKNVIMINNGIDIYKYTECIDNLNPQNLRNELGLQQNTLIIGNIGRLTHQKAQHIFIEAASIIINKRSDIEFIILGEGDQRDYIDGLIMKLGISQKVHLAGFRQDAIQIMKLFEVFVLCSINEGLPIVILEAMSLGVPIVSTDVGDIPNVIHDGLNGILINKGDPSVLSDAILRILDDQSLRKTISNNAKQTVNSEFSLFNMSSKYLNIYKEIDSNKFT
jgi:glycosyltransferase involved in cell wall biosynthesis